MHSGVQNELSQWRFDSQHSSGDSPLPQAQYSPNGFLWCTRKGFLLEIVTVSPSLEINLSAVRNRGASTFELSFLLGKLLCSALRLCCSREETNTRSNSARTPRNCLYCHMCMVLPRSATCVRFGPIPTALDRGDEQPLCLVS